ncbi:MAG: DUF6291 domain-containing protein [Lachnospiraceae bacterium]|nr:DUF6291 domain-containing protein [Lachnospiraceae bacterium]
MAKAKKKKQFVPLFEDYFEQFNLLSFDQAGRVFALIRSYRTMDPEQFRALEASVALENGAKIIWSFMRSDLESYYEEKKKKSETNAANARARWKAGTDLFGSGSSESSGDVPGQKSIIFTAEQTAPDSEPVLTAHAVGMQNDANGMRNDAFASKNDAVASPIYNINNNNIHNNNIYKNPDSIPETGETVEYPSLESIIQFFTDNGSTEEAARKYYNYYTLREWKTYKGELITDVEESVKRWIARDAKFWSKKTAIGKRHSSNRPLSQPVKTTDLDPAANGNKQIHTPTAPDTPYWDGNCYRPDNVKPNSFRDFDQRNYDFDALMKMINARAV